MLALVLLSAMVGAGVAGGAMIGWKMRSSACKVMNDNQ